MANQLRYNARNQQENRSPSPPAPRNNEIIPMGYIPHAGKAVAVLENLTKSFLGQSSTPFGPILNTPVLCAEGLEMHLDHPRQASLRWGDLSIKEPKTASINRLLTRICSDHMRAVGLSPPLHYRHATTTCHLDPSSPGLPKVETYNTSTIPTASTHTMCYLSSSITPVHIVKSPMSLRPIRTTLSHVGYPLIPDKSHSNQCSCPMHVMDNNIEAINFIRACVPSTLRRRYPEALDLMHSEEQHRAGPRHVNTSFTYYSPVSFAGTALPKLILRPSYGNPERENPEYYSPPFAHVDLENNPKIKKALVCQIARPDLQYFTAKLAENQSEDSNTSVTRFYPINKYSRNEDIIAYGHSYNSLETIVLNSVLVEPYKGPRSCPYCDDIIDLTDAADLLNHITEEHRYLLDVNFTCPACLKITIVNKAQFLSHFKAKHSGTLSLMTVLTESHIHARLQLGHVLYMFLTTAVTFKLKFEGIINAQLHYVSPHGIGGYTSDSPDQLQQELEATQLSLLPTPAQEQAAFLAAQPPRPKANQRPRPYNTPPAAKRQQTRAPAVPQPGPSRSRSSAALSYAAIVAEAVGPSEPPPNRRPLPRGVYHSQDHIEQSQSPEPARRSRHPFSNSPASAHLPSIDLDSLDSEALLEDQDDDLIPPARFVTGRQPTPMEQSPSIDEIISMQN